MKTRRKLFTAFSLLLLASTLFAAALTAAAQTRKAAPRSGGDDKAPRSLAGISFNTAAATLREADNLVRVGMTWNVAADNDSVFLRQLTLILKVRRNTGQRQNVVRNVPINRTAEIVDLPNLIGFFNAPPTFITSVELVLNAEFINRNSEVFTLSDRRTLEAAPPANAPPPASVSDVSLEITDLPNPTFVLTTPGQADLRVAWAVGLNPKNTSASRFRVNFNVRLADGQTLAKNVIVNDAQARQATAALNLPPIGDGGFVPIAAIKATVTGQFRQRGGEPFEKTAQRTLNLKGKKN